LSLLKDTSVTLMVVEHRDRLTRFGFHYLETLLETQGRKIEVVNMAENDKEDLIADLVAIVTGYGVKKKSARQIKRCIEQIVKDE
jgi:putative resolvase